MDLSQINRKYQDLKSVNKCKRWREKEMLSKREYIGSQRFCQNFFSFIFYRLKHPGEGKCQALLMNSSPMFHMLQKIRLSFSEFHFEQTLLSSTFCKIDFLPINPFFLVLVMKKHNFERKKHWWWRRFGQSWTWGLLWTQVDLDLCSKSPMVYENAELKMR